MTFVTQLNECMFVILEVDIVRNLGRALQKDHDDGDDTENFI